MVQFRDLFFYTALGAVFCAVGLLARLSWSNLDVIIPSTLLRPFVCIVVLCVILALAAALASRRLLAMVPIIVFLMFSYGSLANLAVDYGLNSAASAIILIVLIALLLYLTRNFEPVRIAQGSCAWLFILAAPISIPMIGLLFQTPPPKIAADFAKLVTDVTSAEANRQSSLPDVIYIIPDRYGSQTTLHSDYNLENSAFYDDLRSRKFSVNPNANANYPTTAHSIASTQNSGYLDEFSHIYGTKTGQLQPLYKSIENSTAQRAMRSLGYRFINAGSWWDPSRLNGNADENYGTDPTEELNKVSMSELENVLWGGTPLREFVSFLMDGVPDRECSRIKRKLDWLSSAGNGPQPVFIMAHMTIPHTPIVADQNGNCLESVIDFPERGVSWPQFKAAYKDYLQYFNKAILGVFDRQLGTRGSTGRKLVFVIQSDEGPYPKTTRLQKNSQSFVDLPASEMRTKLGILNAVYLGKKSTVKAGELRTPINNWRIIFEHLTGTPAGRLDHKVHIYRDYEHIHDYSDVTDQYLN